MRRRVLLAFVGLTAAILVGAVIPLGITATSHDYSAYVEDAQSRTRTAAASAEEWLSDRLAAARTEAMTRAARDGDGLAIMKPGGRVIAVTGPRVVVPPRMISQAEAGGTLVTDVSGDSVLVVAPVRSAGQTVGLVALVRPTERLEYAIRAFWLTLGLIAATALVAAVVIGIGLARWVARPLAVLDSSARGLGDGNLAARAPADRGPAELRRLAVTFNTMAGRIETLMHGHRAVIEDVSHQLRTPLAALRLRLDLLGPDADVDAAAAAEFAGAIGEVARLSRLVDGLLAVARAQNATPASVTVAVAEVIAERVAAWAPVAAERGVQLTATGPAGIRALTGDGYLEQILDNLIANAIDAAGEGNQITVTASGSARGARVVVADDGPGMSLAEMDRAFLRFSTGSASGSGLGLAIVYRLVSSCGGAARLARTEGGGLTVTVDLPGAAG